MGKVFNPHSTSGFQGSNVTEDTLREELQQGTETFVYIHPAADLPSNVQTPSLYFTSYAMRNRISLCATHLDGECQQKEKHVYV